MNLFESIISALSGIWGNKTRSILTMFGIIVGISSVIMITSVGQGIKNTLNSEFEAFGLDKMEVYVTSRYSPIETRDLLTWDDLEMLKEYNEIEEISAVDSISFKDAVILLNPNETRDVNVSGVDQAYFNMNKSSMEILYGRNIVDMDVISDSNVVVIDENFARDVFGKTDCVGEKLPLISPFGTEKLTIVGILKADDASSYASMFQSSATVYTPISFVQRLKGFDSFYYFGFKVRNRDNMNAVGENVKRLLEFQHDNSEKYDIWSISNEIEMINSVLTIFTVFLGFVAAISLLVGGIGVMNIMLVSVTERTKEIGIRKSLGASNGNIKFQFLIEALILTGLGGGIGLLFGYLGGSLISIVAGMLMQASISPVLSLEMIAIAVSISSFIGIVFGVYPAAKAAKLDPIEALRFE